MSISFAPEPGGAVRAAGGRAGMTLPEWLTAAPQARLRKLCEAAGNNASVIGC
jgi:hypothetical protein